MSGYNAKNYTEQGGDVTHIGGKLVIDDGADLSALIDAIKDAGKASVMTDKSKAYGKELSDLIDDDVKINAGGAVTGHFKYVEDYSEAFPGEQEGYFFPVSLSDGYKEQNIKVKRESGEGGVEKTEKDQDWVLRLTDGVETVYSFKTDKDEPILTLSFRGATLMPKPED